MNSPTSGNPTSSKFADFAVQAPSLLHGRDKGDGTAHWLPKAVTSTFQTAERADVTYKTQLTKVNERVKIVGAGNDQPYLIVE